MKSDNTRIETLLARGIAAAGLAAALLQPAPLSAQVDCTLPGRNTPAVPVPEFVTLVPCCLTSEPSCDLKYPECPVNNPGCTPPSPAGTDLALCSTAIDPADTVRLWPSSGFHPASGFPRAPKFPRDSTDRFAGTTIPGASSGHELFRSVDVVTVAGVSRRLYAAYNAGFQIWDLEADPADPPLLTFRDGWTRGDFLVFPGVGEILNFIEDIGAVSVDATTDVAGVAGLWPAGVSLWEFTNGSQQLLRQLYQDTDTSATQIRFVKRNNGTVYAFAGAENGLAVYNVTTARSLTIACLEQESPCSGVLRGFVGNTLNQSRIFIDALHVPATDRIYVSAAGGFRTDFELWEVADPQNPSIATLLYSGMPNSLGSALFQHDGHTYLAVISEEAGIDKEMLKIFLIDGCVSGGACTLTEAVSPIPVAESYPTFKDFLTYSEFAGTPYLYYGAQTSSVVGPDLEQLFDLSSLRPPSPAPLPGLPEVTENGGTYVDPCSGSAIGYWSHYYHRNYHGLNEMYPQVGKFSAQGYFYRAGNSILDVHTLVDAPPPPPDETTVRVDVTDPAAAPYWMKQPITFNATVTPAEDCPGGTWAWSHTDTFTGQPTDVDDVAVIAFELCATEDCPARNPFVSALNDVCPDATSIAEQGVTVLDPRPYIRSVAITPASADNSYDSGTPLTFVASVDGRDDATMPMTYDWEVFEAAGATPLLTLPPKVSSPDLVLDTCVEELSQPTENIFADGFESGDVSAWSWFKAAKLARSAAFRKLMLKNGSVDFRMELTASNAEGQAFHDQTFFTLLGAGPLAFGPDGLLSDRPSQVDATGVTFTVDGNAAEVRWEFEDAAGACVAAGNCATVCQHYGAGCTVFDWAPAADGSQLTFIWQAPNVEGSNRRVTADIRKCAEELSQEISVGLDFVPVSVVPTVQTFEVHPDDIAPQNQPDPAKPCVWETFIAQDLICRPNQTIRFQVTTDADPVSDYQFDWDGTGTFGAFTTNLTHSYPITSATGFTPAVKARKGSGVSEAAGLTVFGFPVTLRIQVF